MKKLFSLTGHQFAQRNTRPIGNHLRDFFFGYSLANQVVVISFGFSGFFHGFHLFFQLRQFAVFEFCRFIEIIIAFRFFDFMTDLLNGFFEFLHIFHGPFFIVPLNLHHIEFFALVSQFLLKFRQAFTTELIVFFFQRRFLNFQLNDFTVDFVHFLGHRVNFGANHRAGFINQIDGFVRQKPVGNITVRQRGRRDNRVVHDLHTVENFVTLLQTAKNGDCVRHSRFIHQNRLETAFKGRVFFDILSVFVKGRGADTVKLSPSEHRF